MMFSRSRQLVKKYLCSSPEVDAKRQMLDGGLAGQKEDGIIRPA